MVVRVLSVSSGYSPDYLLQEIVPFITSTYRTGRWGVFGSRLLPVIRNFVALPERDGRRSVGHRARRGEL